MTTSVNPVAKPCGNCPHGIGTHIGPASLCATCAEYGKRCVWNDTEVEAMLKLFENLDYAEIMKEVDDLSQDV